MTRVGVDVEVVEELLGLDATVEALSVRHPEAFGGAMWKQLRVALYWLRVDTEGRV